MSKASKVGQIILVVCLYGMFRNEVLHYLWLVAQYAVRLCREGRLAGIILSGGRTDPNRPFDSEARTNRPHFVEALEAYGVNLESDNIIVDLEETAINTPQNLHRSTQMIFANNPSAQIVFVCDNVRRRKVQVMLPALRKRFPEMTFSVKSFPRKDGFWLLNWLKQQGAALQYRLFPFTFLCDWSE